MTLRKLLAALAAALLLLGACGGSDDDSSDDASSDGTEAASDSSDDRDDSSDEGDDSSGGGGELEECMAASGAMLSLGFMPMLFAVGSMGGAFTDDTIFTEQDIEEMESAMDELAESVPDDLKGDVDTLNQMMVDAFEDPESFDESEWEEAMTNISDFLEQECGDAFAGLSEDLGDLEDLTDMSIPNFTLPE